MVLYRVPVTLAHASIGGTGVNVWHVRTTGDNVPSSGELQNIVDRIRIFYQNISVLFPGGTTIRYEGEAVSIGDNPEFDASADAWAVTRGGVVGAAPSATALVVGWGTSSASRSGRGRTFLGPIAIDQCQADGTPEGVILTTIRDQASAMIDDLDGPGDGALAVYSPKQSMSRDIISARVRDSFAVLRSRRD